MTVNGAISAFRKAWRHDLCHRRACHPRNITHTVKGDGDDGQEEILERCVFHRTGRSTLEPLHSKGRSGENRDEDNARDVFWRGSRDNGNR